MVVVVEDGLQIESPLSTYQSEVTGYLHMLPFDGKNLRRTRRDPREREDPGAPISLSVFFFFFGNTVGQVTKQRP